MRKISRIINVTGPRKSWKRLYQKYRPLVRKIVGYRLTLPTDELDDVCNEIMIRIYDKIDTYSTDYDFKTWVTTVAINYCNGYYRKRKKDILDRVEDLTKINVVHNRVVETPETIFIDNEDISRFVSYIGKFNEIDTDILYLRYMEGYKYEDISKKLGINVSKVKNVIRNKKDEIKKLVN